MVWHLDNFQGPLEFHGHGSWSLCKAALRQLLPNHLLCKKMWCYTDVEVPKRKQKQFKVGLRIYLNLRYDLEWQVCIFNNWLGNLTPPPLQAFRERLIGKKSRFFELDRKNYRPSRPTSKKVLPLHSWYMLVHIECTSPSKSKVQYLFVHFRLVDKQLNWSSLPKLDHQ